MISPGVAAEKVEAVSRGKVTAAPRLGPAPRGSCSFTNCPRHISRLPRPWARGAESVPVSPPAHRPNDCRINCKAASHSDRDRGTPVAPYCRMAVRAACRRGARIALAGPLGPRANKRRFDSFLQKLAGARCRTCAQFGTYLALSDHNHIRGLSCNLLFFF